MKKYSAVLAFIVLSMPMFTLAQYTTCGGSMQPPCSPLGIVNNGSQVGSMTINPVNGQQQILDTNNFINTLLTLVNWFSWFIGLMAVVMGLYSGFLFITARDNAQQLAAGRKTMLFAIIGIGVAVASFGLIAISRSVLGL